MIKIISDGKLKKIEDKAYMEGRKELVSEIREEMRPQDLMSSSLCYPLSKEAKKILDMWGK